MNDLTSLIFGKESKEYEYIYLTRDYPIADYWVDGYVFEHFRFCKKWIIRGKREFDYVKKRQIVVKLYLEPEFIWHLNENAIIETPGFNSKHPIKIRYCSYSKGIWTLTFNQPLPEIFNIKLDHLIICNQNTHRYDNN